MTAVRDPDRPHPESRSVRDPCGEGLKTSSPVKRCSMPALARTAIRAPASACATDVRPPTALPCRRWREGKLIGTVRLWHVSAGGRPCARARPAGG